MKLKYTPPPQHGQTRQRTRFAWLPVVITGRSGSYRVWLERYIEHSEYIVSYTGIEWVVVKREQVSKLEKILK